LTAGSTKVSPLAGVKRVESKETVNVLSVRYWEMKAEEALACASQMHDAEAVATMLGIAQRYERMARRIAAREETPTG